MRSTCFRVPLFFHTHIMLTGHRPSLGGGTNRAGFSRPSSRIPVSFFSMWAEGKRCEDRCPQPGGEVFGLVARKGGGFHISARQLRFQENGACRSWNMLCWGLCAENKQFLFSNERLLIVVAVFPDPYVVHGLHKQSSCQESQSSCYLCSCFL